MLGNYAKEKSKIVKNDLRCIKGIHPSPLSANTKKSSSGGRNSISGNDSNGFFNSCIFKKVEELVGKPIDWQN